jgi:hypothetical protein
MNGGNYLNLMKIDDPGIIQAQQTTGSTFNQNMYWDPILANNRLRDSVNMSFQIALSNGTMIFRSCPQGTAGAPVSSYYENMWITPFGLIGMQNISPTAWLHLPPSTAVTASLRIPSGSNVTSPNEGDIWYDSTSKTLKMYITGSVHTFVLT